MSQCRDRPHEAYRRSRIVAEGTRLEPDRRDQHATSTSNAAAPRERWHVIQTIREHEADLRALGVERLWLFGSLARGDAGAHSDVDLMIKVAATESFRCSISPRFGSRCASASGGTSTW